MDSNVEAAAVFSATSRATPKATDAVQYPGRHLRWRPQLGCADPSAESTRFDHETLIWQFTTRRCPARRFTGVCDGAIEGWSG